MEAQVGGRMVWKSRNVGFKDCIVKSESLNKL